MLIFQTFAWCKPPLRHRQPQRVAERRKRQERAPSPTLPPTRPDLTALRDSAQTPEALPVRSVVYPTPQSTEAAASHRAPSAIVRPDPWQDILAPDYRKRTETWAAPSRSPVDDRSKSLRRCWRDFVR